VVILRTVSEPAEFGRSERLTRSEINRRSRPNSLACNKRATPAWAAAAVERHFTWPEPNRASGAAAPWSSSRWRRRRWRCCTSVAPAVHGDYPGCRTRPRMLGEERPHDSLSTTW